MLKKPCLRRRADKRLQAHAEAALDCLCDNGHHRAIKRRGQSRNGEDRYRFQRFWRCLATTADVALMPRATTIAGVKDAAGASMAL
jgi:hypothetical protein